MVESQGKSYVLTVNVGHESVDVQLVESKRRRFELKVQFYGCNDALLADMARQVRRRLQERRSEWPKLLSDPGLLRQFVGEVLTPPYLRWQAIMNAAQGLPPAEAFRRSMRPGFLWLWSLLAYLLPPQARSRVFTPAAEDLKADYLESFAKFPGFWSRLLLRLFFTLRTAVLVADCWRVLGIEKGFAALSRVVPERVKRWWVS